MARYRHIDPIEIDDLQPGLSPQAYFLLGVEWEGFRRALAGGAPFSMVVLSANVPRLEAMAQRAGRFVESNRQSPTLFAIVVGNG